VGDLYQVKVADLGSGRDVYAADYCRVETTGATTAMLPVRWMPWEAVLQVINYNPWRLNYELAARRQSFDVFHS